MIVNNGLEYIHNTKRKLKTRFQGKGVNITDSTPFGKYPDFLESELKNKSWQYPSDWCQLTPKAEFNNNTIEFILSDEFCSDSMRLCLQVTQTVGSSGGNIFVKPNSENGYYYIDVIPIPLGDGCSFLPNSGVLNIEIPKGLGVLSAEGYTTYKLIIQAENMHRVILYRQDGAYASEIVAMRAKCDTPNGVDIQLNNSNIKYADLSLTANPKTIFEGCKHLIKAELPYNYPLKDNHFKDCENLREVIGADFQNPQTSKYVFYNCYRYAPLSLNYHGDFSYYNVNLSGCDLNTLAGDYPTGLIKPFNYIPVTERKLCESYKITVNTREFHYNSLKDLKNAVIQLIEGSCYVMGVMNVDDLTDYKENSFLTNYSSLVDSSNFELNQPVGIYIDDFINFKDTEINLPNVPLLWLIADYNGTGVYGPISKVLFSSDKSNFDSTLGKISLQHQNLDKDAILNIFGLLPNSETGAVIDLTGCKGVYELTNAEISTITTKNWVLIR